MKYALLWLIPVLGISSCCIRAEDEESGAAPKLAPGQAAPAYAPQNWDTPTEGGKVTTTNEERGNWFFKKKILEKALDPVQRVRDEVQKILPLKDQIDEKVKQVVQELAPFYQEYSFTETVGAEYQKKIDEELSSLEAAAKIEQPRPVAKKPGLKSEPQVTVPDNSKEMVARLTSIKGDLKKVIQQFARIKKLEQSLQEANQVAQGEIEKAQKIESQAWQDYEKITDTLSDVVAEDMYHSIDAGLTNVRAIASYLSSDIQQFVDIMGSELRALVQDLKPRIDSLSDEGYPLGKKATEKLERQRAEAEKLQAQKKIEKKVPKTTWWGSITGFFAMLWQKIVAGAMWLWTAMRSIFVRK